MHGSRGFTLIELLIVLAIMGILLSFAMVGYRSVRIRGNEASALASLDTINRAQFEYMQVCGSQHYAPSLTSLGVPVPGSGVAFLSPDLTQADTLFKSGYVLTMTGTELLDTPPGCTGAVPVSGYQVTADPRNPGLSGERYFGTNSTRLIYQDGATFVESMPEDAPPPHGSEVVNRP